MKIIIACLSVVLMFIGAQIPAYASAPQMFGVNLSGGEFGTGTLPGTYGTNYVYPGASDFDYFNGKGLTFIRIPFRWERVQHTINGTLDATEMGRLDAVVALAHARGMKILLDMHNYEYYTISGTSYIVGSTQVPVSAFQNVWGQIAAHYKNETAIYGYDLMNEPQDTLANWQAAAQAVVNTIRLNDTTHYVFIEGVNWSGSQTWATSNSTLSVTDSANLLVYSAHSYWNANHDGTYGVNEQGTVSTGVNFAQPFVSWVTSHGYNGHIGEYGVPNNSNNYLASWETSLDGFLSYLKTNNISGTYWSAGPWWGSYPLSCEPSGGVDSLQMSTLQNYNNLSPWTGADIGSVGVAGSNSTSSGVYTVQASGTDIQGSADAFRFVYQQLSGDGTITARVTGLSNTNAWAKAGVMMRNSLSASDMNAFTMIAAAQSACAQYRSTSGGGTGVTLGAVDAAPYWVRLTRAGNVFTSYLSPDGTTWTQIGTPQTIAMGSTVYVGLATTAHNNSVLTTATYDNVQVLASTPTLTGQDVGSVGIAGTNSLSSGVYTVQASGTDIQGSADSFRFVSQQLTGNGTFTARVVSLTNTSSWAKAGVMMRNSLDPADTNVFTMIAAAQSACYQYRSTSGGGTSVTLGSVLPAPYWVRLTRAGNVFTSYLSPDGTTWTQLGSPQTITMGGTVYVGLATTSHNNSALTTATYDHVTFAP